MKDKVKEPTAARALDFFHEVIQTGRAGNTIAARRTPQIIAVVHVVPTLPGYLHGLQRLGDVQTIILKGDAESRDRQMLAWLSTSRCPRRR